MNDTHRHDLFATTRWTMVNDAGGPAGETAALALEELCRIYWHPIYAFVRRHGYEREDAEDLTQGFFAHLLDRRAFSKLDARRGRFRSFLLACLKNYMANDYDRSRRAKRGGGVIHLPLDEAHADMRDITSPNPEEIFDREWALALLKRVIDLLREEWEAREKEGDFDILKGFLAIEGDGASYADAAAGLEISETHVRVSVHRLRKRYRDLLRSEIAHTLCDPALVDEEWEALARALD